MKITKFGHCCLLIEENGVRVLTDPGTYTTAQDEIKNIDVILITHEHQDHFHVPSVKKILENNPEAIIITNNSVNNLLLKEGIQNVKIVDDGNSFTWKDLIFEAFGKEHAVIYKERGLVENTGYFIGERFFYPGDAFYNPKKPVDILALPIAGPWCKVSHSIDFFLDIKPKKMFPVHDGQLNSIGIKVFHGGHISVIAKENNIEFIPLEINTETEF